MGLLSQPLRGLARLPLSGILREYPHAETLVLNGDADLRPPRELHPAFFGCFDWHSAVHGHWTLVRVLKEWEIPEIREAMQQTLTSENILGEVAYMEVPGRESFERMYGWAWLLKLAEELRTFDDADGRAWALALRPLEELIVRRYRQFLPKQTYPIRSGTHVNTAFGLAFAHDHAVATENGELREAIERASVDYFGSDADYPAHLEPGGADFLSPCLVEADLMRRILPREDFLGWFERFLPDGLPECLRSPAVVSDRSDGQIGHLDGLNLSRAWCLAGIGAAMGMMNAARIGIPDAAMDHAREGLSHVATGDYTGDHWLATFAVYLLTH